MLTVFLAVFIIIIIITVVLLAAYPFKPMQGELYRIKETGMTAALGAFLWIEAGFIFYIGFTKPGSLITNLNSRINVYIFLTLSIFFGAAMLLYYFAKSVVVFEDKITFVSFYSKPITLRWEDIVKVNSSMGKRLVFLGKNNEKISIGGERKNFKEFIKLSYDKVPPRAGRDTLLGIKKSLKIK